MLLSSPKLSPFGYASCHFQKITCPDATTDKSALAQVTREKLNVDKVRPGAEGAVDRSFLGSGGDDGRTHF